jgi:hypothetical protein
MIGLKSYLPKLRFLVGLTKEMLYERQRALVDCGALIPEPGRGPGSGVRADADSLATYLISLLAHDLLVEAGMTDPMGWMKCSGERCPLTGKKQFKDALEAILKDEKIAQKVALVIHNRSMQTATIEYLGKRRGSAWQLLRSEFEYPKPKLPAEANLAEGIDTIKTLKPNLIQQVAKDIATFSEVAK